MKNSSTTQYALQVKRACSMIDYSAERFDSLADAKVAARRLARKSEHYSEGNYVEIRQIKTVVTSILVERFEA